MPGDVVLKVDVMKRITPFRVVVYLLLLAGASLPGEVLAARGALVRWLVLPEPGAPKDVLDAAAAITTNGEAPKSGS